MARGRIISKSISTSEKVNRILVEKLKSRKFRQPALGPLLYTWLHPHADDFGRMDGSAYWIKYNVIPCIDISEKEIETILQCIVESELILWYDNGGSKKYIQIIGFEEHQTGLHKRTESKFPGPSEKVREIPGNSGKILVEGEGKGREEEEKKKKDLCGKPHDKLGEEQQPAYTFDEFWQAYPRRNGKIAGKKECLDWWKINSGKINLLEFKAAVEAYARSDPALGGFARDPIRFLKKDWWRDWIPRPPRKDPVADQWLSDPKGLMGRCGKCDGEYQIYFTLVGSKKKCVCNQCGDPYPSFKFDSS